ncbi:hypothetical protein JHK82_050144 [Glycine max]|nr:hypothetical protein JHK82_050144 [Glycine max]
MRQHVVFYQDHEEIDDGPQNTLDTLHGTLRHVSTLHVSPPVHSTNVIHKADVCSPRAHFGHIPPDQRKRDGGDRGGVGGDDNPGGWNNVSKGGGMVMVTFFVVARLLRSTCKWVTNESVRLLRAIIVSQA